MIPELETDMMNLLPRLKLQLSQLISEQSFTPMTTGLAIAYLRIHPDKLTDVLPLIHYLINHDSLAAQGKADLSYNVGRMLNDHPQTYSISDEYFAAAAKYYREIDHRLGPLKIQSFTLSRPNQDPLQVREQLVALSETFLASKYRSLQHLVILQVIHTYESRPGGVNGYGAAYFESSAAMNIAYQIGWKTQWCLLACIPTGRRVPAVGPLKTLSHSLGALRFARMLESRMIVPVPYLKSTMYSNFARECPNHQSWMRLHYAALALHYARLGGEREQISETTQNYLEWMREFSMGEGVWSEARRRLRATFLLLNDKDGDYHLDKRQFQAYAALLTAVFTPYYRSSKMIHQPYFIPRALDDIDPTLRAEIDESINDSLARAQILAERLGAAENRPLWYQGHIDVIRAQLLSHREGVDPDFEASITALQHALRSFSNDRETDPLEIVLTLSKIGMYYLGCFKLSLFPSPQNAPLSASGKFDLFMKAEQHLSAAAEKYRQLRAYPSAAGAEQARVYCLNTALGWSRFNMDDFGHCLTDQILRSLENAAFLSTQRRLEMPGYGQDPQSVIAKQHIRVEHKNVCDSAIIHCLGISRFEAAWNWVQQSKARSVTDMFEL